MAEVNINTVLSPDDRAAIVRDVVDALRPLILANTELLVNGDRMAEIVGMSRSSVDRMRAAGIIPSIGEGRLRRYDPGAVISALQACKKGGEAI